MIVVDDVLAAPHAEDLRALFLTGPYEACHQVIAGKYPDRPEELYISQVKKRNGISKAAAFKQAVEAIQKTLRKHGINGTWSSMAVRLDAGDFLREHVDPGIGVTLYLSKGWQWDWGGLLMMMNKDGQGAEVVVPRFNRMVVINDSRPHFVTPVASYAIEPRYTLIGLVK